IYAFYQKNYLLIGKKCKTKIKNSVRFKAPYSLIEGGSMVHVHFFLADPHSGVPLVLDLMRRMSLSLGGLTLSRAVDGGFQVELVIASEPDGKVRNLLDKMSQMPAVVLMLQMAESNLRECARSG